MVVLGAWARVPGCAAPGPPCGARSGTLVPSLSWTLRCRLLANKARFHTFLSKVSQNGEVSTKKCQKACHSPYISKRPPKVTSWISQISVLLSLLLQGINGLFLTHHGLYCQNDEVSTGCTRVRYRCSGREVSARYPHGSRQQAVFCDPLLIWLSAVFSLRSITLRN